MTACLSGSLDRILEVPESETLVLHWTFDNVTGSGNTSDGLPTTSDAKFIVEDASSGSINNVDRYGWFGDIRYHLYPGQGDFYLPYDLNAVNKEYIPSAIQIQPEVINSSNLVDIRTQDDDLFTKDSRPIKHFYALEKSPYSVISDEILKVFGTIKDFNNIIGEPVNKYRQNYKTMRKFRSLFFERFKNNEIDVEKFLEYFQWFDSSLLQMIQQLVPASAHFSNNLSTVIESHILERNKYQHPYPSLEFKIKDPEAGAKGINELLYNWKTGSAPIDQSQNSNPYWWKNRAERTKASSENTNVDNDRTTQQNARLSALNRSFTSPIKVSIDNQNFIYLSGSIRTSSLRNIKNNVSLRYISASVTGNVPYGTYINDYEIIQTTGRSVNNRYLTKTYGTGTVSLSTFISGIVDFGLPDRTPFKNKYIFVNRFSAPGGPEIMSKGSLDFIAGEYSPYNDLNSRNSVVRSLLASYETIHTDPFGYNSQSSSLGNYHKVNRNIARKLEESGSTIITASVYDNAYVIHAIPQSDLQYRWITASANVSLSPIGYESRFYVPSTTSSIKAQTITYISASDVQTSIGIRKGFAGINIGIYDPLTSSLNLLSSSTGIYSHSLFGTLPSGTELNSLLLHRNGPYQNPSWKHTFISNHPVVRNHRSNNIISVLDPQKERIFRSNSGVRQVYRDRRGDSFTNFIEPCISTKYKPIIHTFNIGDNIPLELKHSYANNLSMFSNPELNNRLEIIKCDDQMYHRLKDFYINTELEEQSNPIRGFIQLSYGETIWPKENNATLNKIRTRLNYSENAPILATSLYNFYDPQQQVVTSNIATEDYSVNGIDRNPLERRSFWRNDPRNRNRWGLITHSGSTSNTLFFNSGSTTTPLINSQGIKDGDSTSIWPFGCTLGHTQSFEGVNDGTSSVMGIYPDYDFGELSPFRGSIGLSYTNFDGGGNAEWTKQADWQLWQNGNSTTLGTGSNNPRYYYLFPTCSALYTKQVYPDHFIFGRYHAYNVGTLFPVRLDDFNHRFRVAEFAGKNPWFDSYDSYAKDIKPMAQDYSIIPEFNISDNMDFYVKQQGGNFRKRNDKFLNVEGSHISQSSTTENSGFNESFFSTYVHSDFMKYLDPIVKDHKDIDVSINKITLKCKGIKKLLPYNGFYPVSRTVQLATMFSQSYAPYISGYGWNQGKTLDSTNPASGTLAVAALLQPFFAPGMLFNSIKAGIAMDFPVFTGSAAEASGFGASSLRISNPPNYKLQFESLLDIKNGSGFGGVPVSSSTEVKRIYWQGVEYLSSASAADPNNRRDIYFEWNGNESSPLYRLAMHNFLAESINFFLADQSLKTIKSKPGNRIKAMTSGSTYYMDVRLYRSDDLLMYGGKFNNVSKLYHTASISGPGGTSLVPDYAALTYTGKFFGHPFSWMDESLYPNGLAAFGTGSASGSHLRTVLYDDGAYAPYLPPYYYKDSIARISYRADGTEKSNPDVVSYILSKVNVESLNPSLMNKMMFYNNNSSVSASAKPSWIGRSTVSSSVNLFGVSKGFKITFDPEKSDPKNGKIKTQTIEDTDPNFNSWVISPKFESPILNFINQPSEEYKIVFNDGDEQGTGDPGSAFTSGTLAPIPKGMWSGYGEFCTGSTGVFLSVEESYPDLTLSQKKMSGSLIDVFGFESKPTRLGEIASTKEISEAIVAIPFVDYPINEPGYCPTINILGKNLFKITKEVFESQKSRREANNAAVQALDFGNQKQIRDTSISELALKMKEYVIPPELNFLQFTDINPFVMYIFEFKHTLDQQDLADIWQGVMPKIAMTAEKDEIEISHPMRPWEFFEGRKIPSDVRWMIFKVKKKAAINYFEKTADSRDDKRFTFDFEVGSKAPEYSYNWPYDFCSLVEFAKIDAIVEIAPLPNNVGKVTTLEKITNLPDIADAQVIESVGTDLKGVKKEEGRLTENLLAKVTVPSKEKKSVLGDKGNIKK